MADTTECVDSLLVQSYFDFSLLLIDNGSDGDDAVALKQRYQEDARVTVRAFDCNLGFVGGMNGALGELVESKNLDYLVLLNNDTLVAPGWLAALVDMARSSGAGIVASCMINYYQRDQLDNAGHYWLNTGEILPRGTAEDPNLYASPAALVGGCAGAALYSVEMLQDIGLFDDYFHTGYEDAELGVRAFLAGYPTHYCPAALVYHKISRSIDKIRNLDYAVKIQKNIYYTTFKLTPWPVLLVNAPFMLLKTLGVLLTALVFWRWRLFKAHGRALGGAALDLPKAWRARCQSKSLRRISSWRVLRSQRFFLLTYLRYFRRYILTGKKTIFER